CTGANSQQGAFTDAGLAANCLKAYGIAKGKADGTFGEDDPLKRSQFASFATRFLTAASIALTARTPFRDVNARPVPGQNVLLELATKNKAHTTYPNAKTDTTKRRLFADMLAELLQKEVDAKVIPNALVVTEAPKGTSSPTIRSVATQSFTSTNSFEYDYDS